MEWPTLGAIFQKSVDIFENLIEKLLITIEMFSKLNSSQNPNGREVQLASWHFDAGVR
jgi:hypothetical protein